MTSSKKLQNQPSRCHPWFQFWSQMEIFISMWRSWTKPQRDIPFLDLMAPFISSWILQYFLNWFSADSAGSRDSHGDHHHNTFWKVLHKETLPNQFSTRDFHEGILWDLPRNRGDYLLLWWYSVVYQNTSCSQNTLKSSSSATESRRSQAK